jgi:hypothetical protein
MAERGDHVPAVDGAKSKKVSGKRWREEAITYTLRGRKRRRSATSDGGKRRSRTFCGRGKVEGGQC